MQAHRRGLFCAPAPRGGDLLPGSDACEAEEEKRQEALAETVRRYILGLKKSELQRALAELLFDGPEWQYERFIRENGLDDAWDQRPARKPRKQPEARNAEA